MKVYRTDGAHITSRPHSRRQFLQAGSIALAGISELGTPKPAQASKTATADAVIQIFLSGGPSQLDTWDPKPLAPSTVRGPFRSIRTSVPGLHLSELFPRMAGQADQFAIVRSLFHLDAPVHETGMQILQTGGVTKSGLPRLPVGALVAQHRPSAHGPSWISLAAMEECVGVGALSPEAWDRYGRNHFGARCLEAVRLIQAGTRMVTINMFPSLYDTISWDCHANEAHLPTNLNDYRNTVCPLFDRAITAMLDDLATSGLLQRTLVVCAGEFGRSPKLNPRGGRDHWTGVWSALFAGGGVRGGQVIGSSDRTGAEPRDRPIAADQVAATVLHALGISPAAQPILDLF